MHISHAEQGKNSEFILGVESSHSFFLKHLHTVQQDYIYKSRSSYSQIAYIVEKHNMISSEISKQAA